jgi:hypothetical protein
MAVNPDPTGWTDHEREFFAAGWNRCVKMQPGFLTALRRIASLAEKNVPKYAQQIAREAIDSSKARTTETKA